ncbi:MAG: 3-phosphoshikimate 1-carboxyvinyltransferase [Acidobacteria bacterium]|nr:3-phosphoshikimate 1-carboxyvinyltransferase [Acidobacteriota bacterium]MBV9475213.1 3-phosphoshikimate 1-carboxyvinyltransferase [Acidobacteriota bacterium]
MKIIRKAGALDGVVTAPPSKSYSVRALLLAAMAEGTTRVENCLDADDTRYALEALRAIGFAVSGSIAAGVTVGARTSMSATEVPIFVGNAGTAMRFFTGWLAFTPGRFLLSGEQRMHERPIGDLVEVLLSISGEVEYVEREGFPPLRIRGKKMRGGFDVAISAETSSQFVSALMLGGAVLPDGITLRLSSIASGPYLDITADILRTFGARVTRDGDVIHVRAGRLAQETYRVEGDWSSASYWFAAAAATGGTMRVRGLAVPTAQGDAGFIDILAAMGCAIEAGADEVVVRGPERLRGGTFDCNATPDIVPTLAAIAPLASTPVEIVNVANLRVKESDRLATVTSELRRLGAVVEERPDALRIEPGWSDAPATIETHNDHRIAMAFAIAGIARGNVTIGKEQVVSKSYPRFWKTLDEVLG